MRLILALCVFFASIASAQRPRPNAVPSQDPLRFQFLGPVAGGRISAVAGVVGDPKTWYMGAASGGVWKSTDSGSTYVPVFDSQPVQAIGSLAVSASNPSIVWAGTGEAWAIRDADVTGDGIYKSTDAGATWTNVGLRASGRIGRIILHPTNPDIAYVCALGRATGPQAERGVYRTKDGGRTWDRVLFVDERTGCSGLAIDANDPNVLIAGMWEVVMHTWAMFSGGPGSGVHLSRDGGDTWTHLESGLPKSPVGKIDVAIAPSNSKRMFALVQTANQGSLWRSDDAGLTWKVVSWDRTLIGRAGYYIRIEVNPRNENEVLVANSTFHRSMDGGLTFPIADRGCGDCHDIWMDPKNADHWAETGDAGAGITWNHGRTFTDITLPIGQMYHVAVDDQVPYYVYSNRQDNGTMRGPSSAPEAGRNSVRQQPRGGRVAGAGRDSAGATPDSTGGARGNPPPTTSPGDSAARRAAAADTAPPGDAGAGFGGGSTWDHGLGGCESGFTIPDPTDTDIVWSSCYGNHVTRWDAKTKRARSVAPWIHTLDSPPNELKYRCHWTPPLAVDPFDPKTVYYGCQVIFKTSNGGQTWAVTSPDLSTRDTSRIAFSGGVVGDNLGQFYGEVVFAIAPSPIRRGLVWAGTNDGQLWNTRDGGSTWTNVTKNIAGLPAWGTFRQIAPSSFDAGTAYATVDVHMMDDREPYLYKTTDYGRTWTKITGDLPTGGPLTYVMSVAENPNKRGMLFVGTGSAFYYSRDDGAHWTRIKDGLPASPVTWIAVPKARWHDVVVSTYGRGIYVLRDITALELGATPSPVADDASDSAVGATGAGGAAPVHAADAVVRLYPARAGYREARSGHADFTFAVPAATREPAKLEIMDSTGAVIRSIQVTTRTGLNRVTWDLRYDPPTRVDLRTTPPDNEHIWEEPRFKGRQVRPIVHWGIDGPLNSGPLALPGRYSVRLTANGTTTPAERFTVTRATETTMPLSDLVASTRAQIRVRDAMNTTASMINRIEIMRKQLEDQRKKSSADAGAVAAVDAMEKKLLDVELRLLSRTDLHSDDKWYVESYKIYMNLVWLSGEIGTGAGDVAGGAEFRPTDASLAVLAMLEKQLAEAKAAYDRVMRDDVAAFNKATSGKIDPLVF